jgi:uncharacterized protein (DUF58 family)
MTGRGRFLSILICVLIFLGLLTRSRDVLVLSLPLLFYLGAAILSAPEALQVTVTRAVSADRSVYARPVRVTVTLENGPAYVEELHLEDILPAALSVSDGEPRIVASLAAGGRITLDYTVRGERGEFRFAGVDVTASDHFGLFRLERQIETSERLLIYPQVVPLRRIDIRPQRTIGFAGPIPARRAGTGVDFYSVRNYVPGDRLRKINWRVSARHDRRLFTNEFQQESLADVGLILDARTQSDIRTGAGTLFEYSVQAAASLADRFLRDGHRVGLLSYGPMIRVFPGYGAVQRERIMSVLAASRTQMSYAFDKLGNLPTRFFPPRSQLVIVTPLLPDDLTGLLRFGALGYTILIVCPDPIAFEVHSLPAAAKLDLPIRLARLERAVMLSTLQRAGMRVVNWETSQPLDPALFVGLARQPVATPRMAMVR